MTENAQDAFPFNGISKGLPGRFIDQDLHLSAHFNLIPPPVGFGSIVFNNSGYGHGLLSIPLSREWLDFSCAILPFAFTTRIFVSPTLK